MIELACPYCGHWLVHPEVCRTHYLYCVCGKGFTAKRSEDGEWMWLPGVHSHPDLHRHPQN